MDYVRMPKADYVAACNALRDRTGESAPIKSGEMAGKIVAIQGGGSSTDVRYVTFMSYDGTVEYGKKAVAAGDNCANPIGNEWVTTPDGDAFVTPTRESTAQYDYTFAGWATVANGGLNDDALEAVTEDRTVYANFAAVLRSYTVSFYDGDTILKSVTLTYGSVPSAYTPEKSGYSFNGWDREVEPVTGDTAYYAQWVKAVTFAGSPWADIAEVCESGEASKHFKIGDKRNVVINGETLSVEIIGFSHDDLADGSGKAGITIGTVTMPSNAYALNTTSTSQAPAGYSKATFRATLNNFTLPSDLAPHVKQVTKISDTGVGGTLNTTTEKIWLFSVEELGLTSDRNIAGQGTAYARYTTKESRQHKPVGKTSNAKYWLRSADNVSKLFWHYCFADGSKASTIQPWTSSDYYACFGFCI